MQFNFTSFKDLFWYLISVIYSLIPSIFFLSIAIIVITSFNPESLPSFISSLVHYFNSFDNSFYKTSLFIITAFILSLISDAISSIILWYGGGDSNSKINFELNLDEDIGDKLRLTDLVGLKIMHEFVNFNSWTFYMLATKTIILAIQNYINLFLLLFIPLILYVFFQLTGNNVIFLALIQILLTTACFYSINKFIKKLKNIKSITPNWKDVVITNKRDYLILLMPIILSLILLFSLNLEDSFLKSIILMISFNFFLFPLQLFLVLNALNLHNRVRRMVESAFYQIRFDDKIFRGNPKPLDKKS